METLPSGTLMFLEGKNLGFSAVLANIKNLSAPPGGKTSGA